MRPRPGLRRANVWRRAPSSCAASSGPEAARHHTGQGRARLQPLQARAGAAPAERSGNAKGAAAPAACSDYPPPRELKLSAQYLRSGRTRHKHATSRRRHAASFLFAPSGPQDAPVARKLDLLGRHSPTAERSTAAVPPSASQCCRRRELETALEPRRAASLAPRATSCVVSGAGRTYG